MSQLVRLSGGGVATATAAHLLAGDGFEIEGGDASGPGAPVVMLSAAALALLRDVFGRAGLFADRAQIARRVVAWDGDTVSVAHEGIVVSGEALMATLPSPACGRGDSRASAAGEGVPQLQGKKHPHPARQPQATPSRQPARLALSRKREREVFALHAASPFPKPALCSFGTRIAAAAIADLATGSDPHACHVEATPQGWLFLIPQGKRKAWLLAVGGEPDALLGASALVAAQLTAVAPVFARFETAPRILQTLGADNWLALGTRAIAFDPICGDGTAHAVREGILAAAVIAGVRDGGDRVALTGHYRAMLLAAMRRHLQISLNFYASGGTSPWWREQVEALTAGHDWCTARLGALPEPRFVLQGTRLVPRAMAA